MELSISGVISNLPHLKLSPSRPPPLLVKTSLPLKNLTVSHRNSGFNYFGIPSRADISKSRIASVSESFEKQSDGVVTVEEDPSSEGEVIGATEEVANEELPITNDENPAQNVQFETKVSDQVVEEESPITLDTDSTQEMPLETKTTEQEVNEESPVTLDADSAEDVQVGTKVVEEVSKEESPTDEQPLAVDFLDKLNIKLQLDSDDKYPILLYGGGALVALWLALAVISAIDSIPLLPKVLELVGLAYGIWFSSRYLIFKKNRDELTTKIEELKEQVIGSKKD